MLKPKKKITKKDIQRDPLLEFLNDATINLKNNRTRYLQIFAGIVIVVLLVVVITGRINESNQNAESQLGLALAALEVGDTENAQFQLENMVGNGGSGKVNFARYYLANIRYQKGDYAGARSLLEEFLNGDGNDIITPKGYLLLATILENDGNYEEALSAVNKGIRKASINFYKNALKIKKAEILFRKGDIAGAGKLNGTILENEKLDTSLRIKAEMLSGKLNG